MKRIPFAIAICLPFCICSPGGAATVRGKVISKATGKPLPDIPLDLIVVPASGPRRISQLSHTNAAGEYAFENVIHGEYAVQASRFMTSELAYKGSDTFPVRGSEIHVPDLILPKPPTVRGRILNDKGEPTRDAEVRANWIIILAEGMRSTLGFTEIVKTDSEGRFTMRPRGAGRAHFTATVARHGYGSTMPLVLQEEELVENVDVRLTPGAELTGVVRDQVTKKPLPRVDVSLSYLGSGGVLANAHFDAQTNDEGRYSFSQVPAGKVSICLHGAYLPSFRGATHIGTNWMELMLHADRPNEFNYALAPRPRLNVKVVGKDGAPISGAWVWSDRGEPQRTDAQGRAQVIPDYIRDWRVAVRAPGYATSVQVIPLAAGDVEKDIGFVLTEAGATMQGQVTFPGGKPVKGATVIAMSIEDETTDSLLDSFQSRRRQVMDFVTKFSPDPARAPIGGRSTAEQIFDGNVTTSDELGQFELMHVTRGRYQLWALLPQLPHAVLSNIEVKEGEVVNANLVADVAARFHISGIIRTPDGKPFANSKVDLYLNIERHVGNRTSNLGTSVAVRTDADGRYFFVRSLPGIYFLAGGRGAPTALAEMVKVEVTGDESHMDVDLTAYLK